MIVLTIDIIETESPILKNKIDEDINFDYSEIVISFSDFFHKIELIDVYTGIEDIPFKERDSEYKDMLKAEFL